MKCMGVSHSVMSLCNPMDYIAHQAPLFMGFSREENWSGLQCTSPGDLPNSGMEPGSPTLKTDYLLSEPLGKTYRLIY